MPLSMLCSTSVLAKSEIAPGGGYRGDKWQLNWHVAEGFLLFPAVACGCTALSHLSCDAGPLARMNQKSSSCVACPGITVEVRVHIQFLIISESLPSQPLSPRLSPALDLDVSAQDLESEIL